MLLISYVKLLFAMQPSESETNMLRDTIYGTAFETWLIRDTKVLEQSDWLLLAFDRTINFEGFSERPYDDGPNLAVGFGVNVNKLSYHEAYYLAWARYIDMYGIVSSKIKCFEDLPITWKSVLLDIQYNTGDLFEFTNFVQAICDRDLLMAITELKDSNYYHQVTSRAEQNIKHLERSFR